MVGVKVLALISSGDKEKVVVGLRWAFNAKTRGWVDDVKVFLFGPSEDLVAKRDEEVTTIVKMLADAGVEVVACRGYAERRGISRELENALEAEAAGRLDFVGPLIAKLIAEGYHVVSF